MRVRALARYVPNVGREGEEATIDDPSARVLILLGKVERVEAPKKPKRRTYKRRDMVPEQPPAVEVEQAPEPPPEEPEEDSESEASE